MNELQVNCKLLHPKAKLPYKKNFFDAGWDLYSIEDCLIKPGEVGKIKTGLAVEIPNGYVGLIWARSSMGSNGQLILGGVIDSTYRGEITVMIGNFSYKYKCGNNYHDELIFDGILNNNTSYQILEGDKIAQLLIQECNPFITMNIVNELSDSERGNKGFGSSGK